MRISIGFAYFAFCLMPPSGASAQNLPPPADAGMPIALVSAVTDMCFQVVRQNTLSPEMHLILDPLPGRPAALTGMYPLVPTWYGMKKEPRQIFIGVGDKPNLCPRRDDRFEGRPAVVRRLIDAPAVGRLHRRLGAGRRGVADHDEEMGAG